MAAAWGVPVGNAIQKADGTYYMNGVGAMVGYVPSPAAPMPAVPANGSLATSGKTPAGVSYSTTQTAPAPTTATTGYSNGGQRNGQASIAQPAYETQQQTQLEADLRAKAQQAAADQQAAAERERARLSQQVFSQRLAELSKSNAGNPAATIQPSSVHGEQTARDAAFAHAKEQAGETGLASLRALQGIMDSRGLTGSTVEGQGVADIVNGARGEVNAFTGDQAISDVNREADLRDLKYQGDITQRGQDQSLRQSLMGLMTASGLY